MRIFKKEKDYSKEITLFFMELLNTSLDIENRNFLKNFQKTLLMYRVYEVNGMLLDKFKGLNYDPCSNIFQKDNSEINSVVQDILINFESYMIEYNLKIKKQNQSDYIGSEAYFIDVENSIQKEIYEAKTGLGPPLNPNEYNRTE